jgi:hypothetical protein
LSLTFIFIAPDLAQIATQDALIKLVNEMSEEEKKEIMQHLPEGQQTEEKLRENLCSP